jgi:hypothetical protein
LTNNISWCINKLQKNNGDSIMKTTWRKSSDMVTYLKGLVSPIIQFITGLFLNQKAIRCVPKGESNAKSVYKKNILKFGHYQFVKRKWILFFADGPGLLGPKPIPKPD